MKCDLLVNRYNSGKKPCLESLEDLEKACLTRLLILTPNGALIKVTHSAKHYRKVTNPTKCFRQLMAAVYFALIILLKIL